MSIDWGWGNWFVLAMMHAYKARGIVGDGGCGEIDDILVR